MRLLSVPTWRGLIVAVVVACSSGAGPGGAPAGNAGPRSAVAPASTGAAAGLPGSPSAAPVIHIVGDSTAAIFPPSDPRVGWGAVLGQLVKPEIQVDDRALSGRSTKSFIDEGAWAALIAVVRAGDYVLIGFGHNDEKREDPSRYTDPATTFRDHLRRFVDETRGVGGRPVLLTPISRRKFRGAELLATHGAYPDAVRAVATETRTPLIDLTERTRAWLEELGPTRSVAFFAPDDQTHTVLAGAQAIAGLVATELHALRHPLAAALLPPAPLPPAPPP